MIETDGRHMSSAVDDTELQVVHHSDVLGHTMMIYGTADDPLFLATDVAAWIGHTNVTKMLSKIDPDEKRFDVCTTVRIVWCR